MREIQNLYDEAGQSIIEAVVAVSVVVLIIITLVSAVTVSVKNATFAKNKSLATKYVNQGLEAVRSIRDSNWQNLLDASGKVNGLSFDGSQWIFSGSSDTPATSFTRTVTVSGNETEVIVEVKVSWIQGTKTFSSSATTNFTRWKP